MNRTERRNRAGGATLPLILAIATAMCLCALAISWWRCRQELDQKRSAISGLSLDVVMQRMSLGMGESLKAPGDRLNNLKRLYGECFIFWANVIDEPSHGTSESAMIVAANIALVRDTLGLSPIISECVLDPLSLTRTDSDLDSLVRLQWGEALVQCNGRK